MKWVAIVDDYYDGGKMVHIAKGPLDRFSIEGHNASKAARKLALGLLKRVTRTK